MHPCRPASVSRRCRGTGVAPQAGPTDGREGLFSRPLLPPRSRTPPIEAAVLLLIVAAAVLVRAYPWFKPHAFTGVLEYDDGVYYAAAKQLLHGRVPYRDFVILHPPGSVVALAPFAALGAVTGDAIGMAVARLAVLFVSIVNVLLVYHVARGFGFSSRGAATVGSAVYATFTGAVLAEHTVLLEPLANFGCLLSALILSRTPGRHWRAVFLPGVALGFASSMKLFALAYLAAVIAWMLAQRRWSHAGSFLSGFMTAFLLILAPFLAVAPSAVTADIFRVQAARPADGGMSTVERINDMFGLFAATQGRAPHWLTAVALFSVVAACVWLVYVRGGAGLWITALGLSALAFCWSSSYFSHYAGFLAPPLAMVASAAVSRTATQSLGRHRPQLISLAATSFLLAYFLIGDIRTLGHWRGQGDLRQAAQDWVPQDACMVTDAVSLMIAADRLRLPTRDCPGWIDGRGVALTMITWESRASRRGFYPAGFLRLDNWQKQTLEQIKASDFLLVRGNPLTLSEWSGSVRSYVRSHFSPRATWEGQSPWQLWQRSILDPQGSSEPRASRALDQTTNGAGPAEGTQTRPSF